MKCLLLLAVTFMLLVVASGLHLKVGECNGNEIFQTIVDYWRIPFVQREPYLFYNDPHGRKITGIFVKDLKQPDSEAKAMISAGGIGFSYVNLIFQSESGKGLLYNVALCGQ